MTMTETAIKTKLVTADDLMLLYSQGVGGELIRGVLQIPRSIMPEHDAPRINLEGALRESTEGRGLGTILTRAGVWLEGNPDTVRKADIAYISSANLQSGTLNYGYPEAAPDLLVDVVTPTDRFAAVSENARMWSDSGVPLVWIAYLGGRSVDVYHADGSTLTLTEDDTLDGGEVLPGFSCRVSEIFHQ